MQPSLIIPADFGNNKGSFRQAYEALILLYFLTFLFFMNDKEKLEAIKKLLSINTQSFEEYAKYVGLIHDILDEKMTMTEVDDYIRDNF